MAKIKHLYILLCLLYSISAFGQKAKVTVEKLPASINTSFDEMMPVLSGDGKQLYFTRAGSDDYNRTLYFGGVDLFWERSYSFYLRSLKETYYQLSGQRISDPIHSAWNQDIWVANINEDSTMGKVAHLPYPANSALPNSLCSTTPNPEAYIVMNQYFPKGGMQAGFSLIRKNKKGEWSFPKPIEIEGFTAVGQSVNLTLSKDGTTMLLSMNRGDSHDNSDLYVSFLKASGKWSYPINLGRDANSAWKDSSPFLADDNRTIFFSSNRADVFGGANIYSMIRLDDTWRNWSKPTLLVNPINTNADESHPAFDFNSGFLFFSSNRGGQSDIYKVRIEHPTIEFEDDAKEYVGLEGQVVDEYNWLVPGATIYYRPYNFVKYKKATVAEDGTFEIRVPKGKKIHLIAKKEGYEGEEKHLFYRLDYLYFKKQFVKLLVREVKEAPMDDLVASNSPLLQAAVTTPKIKEKPAKKKFVPTQKLKTVERKGKKIELKPIYFERSKARILHKSYSELNRLVRLLKKHPEMRIRVEGHTDGNGKKEDLLNLSQDRATAMKAYLVNRGIDESRITSIGYGDKYPVTDNATERNRQQNRRVEVYVLNKVEGVEFLKLRR